MEQLTLPIEVDPPAGYVWIFRPWVTDPKTGQRRYPRRSRVFRLLVKAAE